MKYRVDNVKLYMVKSNGHISSIGTENHLQSCSRFGSVLIAALKGVNKGMEKVPVDGKEREKLLEELTRV